MSECPFLCCPSGDDCNDMKKQTESTLTSDLWGSNEYLKEIGEYNLKISRYRTIEDPVEDAMDTLSHKKYFPCLELFSGVSAHIIRDKLVRKYAWAIPTLEALTAIAKYPSIVEIGAGTGYWAYLLKGMGVDVVCYDIAIENKPPENVWHFIENGDEKRVDEHADRALFLCWPNYATPMAANCLKRYKGDTVIYIGEGSGGCTGDGEFHEILENEWCVIETIEILKWSGIHDHLWIYHRNQ